MPIVDTLKSAGVDGETDAARPDVHVHDITVSKFQDSDPGNLELTVKVLDAGTFHGAMTNVDVTIKVVDTETGVGDPVESELTYSGQSGGINESTLGGHDTGALRNVSGNAMPAPAGDNLQTYLEIQLTDASGKASEDDFAAAPAGPGELPASTTGRGVFVLSTSPISPETDPTGADTQLKLDDADSASHGTPHLIRFNSSTPGTTIGDESFDYALLGTPPGADHPGVVNTMLLDGSVRGVSPATDTHAVTERTSGLVYSGESGGLNESQTGHYTQMVWAETSHQPAVQPNAYSWGLDRIDQRSDAADPFFAYDAGFLGGVNVGASAGDAGFGGGIFVAAGDIDGVRPHVFGDFDLV